MNKINKIITIAACALVIALAIMPVITKAQTDNGGDDEAPASAPASTGSTNGDDDSGSVNSGGNTPSGTTNGDDDGETAPSSEDNNSNPSSRSSRNRSRGGSGSTIVVAPVQIDITNVRIVSIGGNQFRVQWSTSIDAQSQLAFGTASVGTPSKDTLGYGYQTLTNLDNGSTGHVFVVTVAPNQTYFMRPIAIKGSTVAFGQEVKVLPNTTLISGTTVVLGGKTSVTSTKTTSGTPSITIPSIPSTTSPAANNNLGASAGASVGTKVANFFKNLWGGIWNPICKIAQ